MSMFANLNKNFESPFVTEIPQDAPYKKLSELEDGKDYTIVSAFINPKSKYGEHPVVGVLDTYTNELFNLSLPKHLTETIKAILDSEEYIIAVNSGECKFYVKEGFSKKYNRAFSTIEFI